MLILDRYRLGTIVSQRRMIFLATESESGRPVWIHVIAEPVDSNRAEIVRRANHFIETTGGGDEGDFIEYGFHDKTHYVVTAPRPECKELGPYLDTLLALRGIDVPAKTEDSELSGAGTIVAGVIPAETPARLQQASDSAVGASPELLSGQSGIRQFQPPPEGTMSGQPTIFSRREDVQLAGYTPGPAPENQEASGDLPPNHPRIVEKPDDSEATIRFVRPRSDGAASRGEFDPDQTAKLVSQRAANRGAHEQRERVSAQQPASASREERTGEYPVWTERASAREVDVAPQAAPAQPERHQNGSGSYRLVLPPVRRPSAPASSAAPAVREALPPVPAPVSDRSASDKFLYMALALIMVSLASFALGIGWFLHSNALRNAPPPAAASAVSPDELAANESPLAMPTGASVKPAAATPQPTAAAEFNPLLLSIAFISALLIFAAVVVLLSAVRKRA